MVDECAGVKGRGVHVGKGRVVPIFKIFDCNTDQIVYKHFGIRTKTYD